ncbi:MAG: glycosyltransferase [Bryobacterales bacterium]
MSQILPWLLPAFFLLTLCAAGYNLAVCLAAWRFLRDRARSRPSTNHFPDELPAVSILKPVAGADLDFYENIRSHALQDYPNFELLFGAGDPNDPALEAIGRLAREFPHLRIEAFVCECTGPGNHKVQRLERLQQEARFEFFLVNDSDIRVERNYVRDVMRPFLDSKNGPRVGLVSCPFRARPGPTLASLTEALAVAEFQGQVLLTRLLRQVDFALGATMLFRRGDLERIGGFSTVAPYLADDYQLGNRIQRLGLDLVISTHAVEIALGDDGWREVWQRQLRWSRTIRACRPGGHFGLFFTQASLWSLLCLAAAAGTGSAPTVVAVPCAALLLRLFAAWLVGWRCMGSRAVARRLYWMFVADGLAFAAWCGSFFTRRVHWRNRVLEIGRDGRIARESPSAPNETAAANARGTSRS